jgi:hypothetical protein
MPSKSSASGKRRGRSPNLLDLVPVRSPDFSFVIREQPALEVKPREPGAAGTVSVSIPRFRGRFGTQVCNLAHIRPDFDLNLDAYGSFVWLLIDGKTTVRELGLELKEEYGEKVEPLYGRLAHFLSLLERNRLLTYVNISPRKMARKRKLAVPR